MALIADFVAATQDEALHYYELSKSGQLIPPDRFERAEHKNFTSAALEMLLAVLRGEASDQEASDQEAPDEEPLDQKRDQLELISHTEDGKNWLLRFPDALVHSLSGLDDATIAQTADAWGATKDVPGTADELKPVLRDLQGLAASALRSGKGLYVYGSL